MTSRNFITKKTIAMKPTLHTPKNQGKAYEQSLDKYFELTESKELANLVGAIRHEANPEKRRELKAALPYRCPHYFRFKDNHRAQGSIIPEAFTWQTCVDIDDADEVKGAIDRAFLLNNKDEQWKDHLLHMEYSASGKLHIDIRIPVGMTISEAQVAYCKALGVAFDEKCCSPERMIYITDKAQRLYLSDEWYAPLSEEELKVRRQAYLDRGLDIDGRERKTAPTCEGTISQTSDAAKADAKEATDYPADYTGVPYEYIVEELTDQLGGIPEHGSRNSFLFTMACHLRYICNDDSRWIQHVMPNFGEDQQRVNATIESACRRYQSKTMPVKVQMAIQLARVRVNAEKGVDADSLMRQPQMPKRLPAPIRHLLSKAPKGYHPCISSTIFAAFATYTGGVKAMYWNNTETELTMIELLAAPMSSGKSSIKAPIDHVLARIEKRDQESRAKEKKWAEDYNCKANNADKPKRPDDICTQIVDSDITNASLCQHAEDAERAGNKALFTRMDEMEQLNRIAGGSERQVTQILRRDFDTDFYGQERVGTMSQKSRSRLRWNITVSTTIETARDFMCKNLDNGTSSRINLSTIVREDVERRPKFGTYDVAFDKKLDVYLDRLEAAKGTINCAQARQLAEKLLDRAEERALMIGNESFNQLAYRSVEIAFRKSILLYIMCGKWTKEIEEFVIWTFDYDMWCKMCLMGSVLHEKLEREHRIMKPGLPCMLEQLGDTFTRQEYDVLERKFCPYAKQRGNLLSQWKSRGWVEYNQELQIYVKTKEYYDKHTA